MGGTGLITNATNSFGLTTSAESGRVGEAKSEAVSADSPATDPDLAKIVAAWPRLHENIKAAIRMMVESDAR